MRALIQRVAHAEVTIADRLTARIEAGLLIFLGIEAADEAGDIEWLAGKIVSLRVFNDDAGVMNRSVLETGGDLLLVSQFTLHASTRKGNRPSYSRAARPEVAGPLYETFHRRLESLMGKPVPTGVFGSYMKVALLNDGPVTIMIDSKTRE